MVPRTETAKASISPPLAALLTSLALALFNAIWTLGEGLISSSAPERGAAAYGYDLLLFLAAGTLIAGWLAVCLRIPCRALANAAVGLAVLALVYLLIVDDLSSFLDRTAPSHADALKAVAAVTIAFGYTAFGALAPQAVNSRGRRLVAALSGVAVMALNGAILPLDYPGTHLLLALSGGLLFSVAIVHTPFRWRRPAQFGVALCGGGAALVAIALPPKNATRVALITAETSSLAPFMARLWSYTETEALTDAPEPGNSPIRNDDIPGLKLPANAMVLLITIDAVRADVLVKHPEKFPTLSRMSKEGTTFRLARAAGSQTAYSLTSLFTSKYYSQQYWSKSPPNAASTRARMGRQLWPFEDQSVRFTELLSKAGVRTINAASASWLTNPVGVVSGFSEDEFVKGRSTYTRGNQLTAHILGKLEPHGDKPLFLYAHYLDPHVPYDRGGKSGTPYERYLREIQLVDSELGRLWTKLRAAGHGDRLYWIISADHGEAFGDHGAKSHGTTVYEEQLRVPLIFNGPKIPAQEILEPVSLIDLAPTIIELFGLPPEHGFMGESLAPFFVGAKPRLDRLILAETRLKKVLYAKDSMKAIVDDRNHTIEVYDLKTDPGETRNLADEPSGEAPVRQLRAFFTQHRLRRTGYKPPYRP